jgi:hypothetical protein
MEDGRCLRETLKYNPKCMWDVGRSVKRWTYSYEELLLEHVRRPNPRY